MTTSGCHFGTKLFGKGIYVKMKAQERVCVRHAHAHNQTTRRGKFATASSNYAMKNDASCQSGYCTDHTDRPWLCDVCWERVEMTHSTATYTAVDDYDNSCTALHKQLCGAVLIIPDSLPDFLYSTFPPPHHSPFCLFSSFPLSSCFSVFPSLG